MDESDQPDMAVFLFCSIDSDQAYWLDAFTTLALFAHGHAMSSNGRTTCNTSFFNFLTE